jgi:3-phosphoshikimate 1-carboxyvinyltransferase
LYAEGETMVSEPAPTRDHTERMLRGFGYSVLTQGARIRLRGGGKLQACKIDVPADVSSAAFFLVGASIAPGSDLVLEHVGVNPTRTGALNILKLMGANLELINRREVGGEPVADIRVRAARLHGIRMPAEQVPLAIDEFPALFIAAACAEGETVLTGAQELRVKESDRIAVMAQGLTRLGIEAMETPDGIVIQGGRFRGGVVDSHGDHRAAMAFALAGLRAAGPVTVSECQNVSTSFPGFVELAARAGLSINIE